MAEPQRVEIDGISSTDHSVKDSEKALGRPPAEAKRNQSVYSTSGRKVSEWEALQIAAAGDLQTINAEVDAIEVDLQAMSMRSTWYKPLIKFSDPKYFTWLLVGECACPWHAINCLFEKQDLLPWAVFFLVLISR
jgi:hypothetical protein